MRARSNPQVIYPEYPIRDLIKLGPSSPVYKEYVTKFLKECLAYLEDYIKKSTYRFYVKWDSDSWYRAGNTQIITSNVIKQILAFIAFNLIPKEVVTTNQWHFYVTRSLPGDWIENATKYTHSMCRFNIYHDDCECTALGSLFNCIVNLLLTRVKNDERGDTEFITPYYYYIDYTGKNVYGYHLEPEFKLDVFRTKANLQVKEIPNNAIAQLLTSCVSTQNAIIKTYDYTKHPAYEDANVKGTWLHVLNKHVDLRSELQKLISIKGEICVSAPADYHYFAHRTNFIALLFTGTVSHLYNRDCYSFTIEVNGYGYRLPSQTGETGGLRSEGFLDPSTSKFEGFVVGNEHAYKDVKYLFPNAVVHLVPNRHFRKIMLKRWIPELREMTKFGIKVTKPKETKFKRYEFNRYYLVEYDPKDPIHSSIVEDIDPTLIDESSYYED